MAEVIHECEFKVVDDSGVSWSVRAMGEPRGNVWVGWLEFTAPGGKLLRTGEETSQPDREAAIYWASGLEPVFLEGALGRARAVE